MSRFVRSVAHQHDGDGAESTSGQVHTENSTAKEETEAAAATSATEAAEEVAVAALEETSADASQKLPTHGFYRRCRGICRRGRKPRSV